MNRHFKLNFATPEEEIHYLRQKIVFLVKHARDLTSEAGEAISKKMHERDLVELKAIRASLSWRITKPLRTFKQTLIWLKRRVFK